MQTNTYRAMFTEALTAQTALLEAFVGVGSFYLRLIDEGYRAVLAGPAAEVAPAAADGEPALAAHTAALAPRPADVCRAVAGLPRVSMMLFLARYDELRGPRRATRN